MTEQVFIYKGDYPQRSTLFENMLTHCWRWYAEDSPGKADVPQLAPANLFMLIKRTRESMKEWWPRPETVKTPFGNMFHRQSGPPAMIVWEIDKKGLIFTASFEELPEIDHLRYDPETDESYPWKRCERFIASLQGQPILSKDAAANSVSSSRLWMANYRESFDGSMWFHKDSPEINADKISHGVRASVHG